MIKKEKIKYELLFIDIEWNQKDGTCDVFNREPVQIALLGTDYNFENTKIFSKSIRLDDVSTLTEKTCKLTHTNEKAVMMGNSLETVFTNIEKTFPKYNFVVVWTMETYELFIHSMKKTGVEVPKHKVLVLQDIISIISQSKDKKIGFKKALDNEKISYENNYLHYSKHDVQYMFALYKKTYNKYHKLTKNEFSIVNERSGIIHAPYCRYAKDTVESDKKMLIFHGYRPCKCCGNEDYWRRINYKASLKQYKKYDEFEFKDLPLTEENIHRVCTKYNINYSISDYIVFLTTNRGYWRIYLKNNEVDKVYHANYKNRYPDLKKKKKFSEGFHQQNISTTNFFDVVRYIYFHDRDLYVKNKRTGVDKLFDRI